jgi:formate dehydrogenase assembly factor FdhD
MSAVNWIDELQEDCEDCDRRTPHEVSIEMRTESQHSPNSAFSREPYRVSECTVCGTESITRMNNA